MVAYEFYYCDKGGDFHLLGILPERRESPMRITQESIMQWGKMVIGDVAGNDHFYFIQVNV